jgi:two-component system, OmpR family, sensor kinase
VSLRARITLWFTALLVIALASVGFLVFTLVNNELQADVDASIENKAHDAALSIRSINGKLNVPQQIKVPESQFRTPTLYTEIRDINWQAVWRSDTLQDSDLPTIETTQASAQNSVPVFETITQAGERIRLYTAPILIRGQMTGYVQVARNLADIDVVLLKLRTWLLVSSGLVIAIAAVGGFLLSRAALRPIDQITRTAHEIGIAQRLDQRLPRSGRTDEVGRLAATFNEMLERLEAIFVAQRRFVADASHELRTPLTTIQGNVEFVRRDPTMPPVARDEALADVADAASRMNRLVDGLLALARADAGRHLERRPVSLRPILETCYHQTQALARATDISVELTLNRLEPGARLNADPDKLRELLMTLLENAVKYNLPDGRVCLAALTDERTHRIMVSDTGRGIAPADLDHIFERFYRSPRTRGEDGSGLGLAIAHWIVDEHDGKISVESVQNQGSTFVVTLPALKPAPLLTVP